MIRNIVHSLILLFSLLFFTSSCTNLINEKERKYVVLRDKGDASFYEKTQLDSAYFYYQLAYENCADKKGENGAYVLLQTATVQQHIGDFYGSEETITEALSTYEGTLYRPYLYNMLAIAYDKQKKFDDALRYYKMAYASFNDPLSKAIAQSNIGLIYQEKGNHDKAIQLLSPLLKNRPLKANPPQIARVLDNIGYSQFKLNNAAAYSNLYKSLQIRDSLQDVIGSIPSNIHLSAFFMGVDKPKAKQYAVTALLASKKVNSPDDQLEALRLLIENSEPIAAKQYTAAFISLNDSLTLSRNSAKNQFAKIKYDSKKAIENEQKYKVNMQLAVLLAVLILLSSFLLLYFIRKRNRKKLVASVYETENRIAKKIHDELANDVYQTMAFAETQNLQKTENREALLDNLENIYSKARDISQTNAEIYTDERYSNFLLDLINSFNSNDVTIILKNISAIDWSKINTETKIAIYRVLQELLVNMKKYSEANLVMLNFEDRAKLLEIKYADNGKGIDTAKFSKKGLQNAENRIEALKGTFTFDKEVSKGFRVTLQIPK
ncbi:hypothetical protein QWY90_03015 [Flavobacterium paronense]|uniref:histidine kinase n=1 Tax=Flavobacterium paronense TaxID=1392775 RepID=A0ABV5GCP9_9FLAO|nr:hypothetical protein [Flavobacterium paronense]MDN3676277.1 hypothetical protein [Flavobacterium paronense]